MKKILLSYSSLYDLHISPHSWLNKQLGVVKETTPAMEKGKELHKLIQDHVAGKKDTRLSAIEWEFPTAEFHCRKDWNEKYQLHAYLDGCNFASKTFMEVKTGKNAWTQGRFNDLIQAPYYAFVSNLHKCYFVTCDFDLKTIKTFYKEFTPDDLEKARKWAEDGIKILEGDLKADLVDGKCLLERCPYGNKCFFKSL